MRGVFLSYQKIGDQTTMPKNPVLDIQDGVLFWTSNDTEAIIGFDIASHNSFSQTLSHNKRDENILELPTATYDVTVASTSIDFEFKPDATEI